MDRRSRRLQWQQGRATTSVATLLQTSVLAVRLQVVLTTIKTRTIILATGADSNWLGIEGAQEYRGGGVSSCATCDGCTESRKWS